MKNVAEILDKAAKSGFLFSGELKSILKSYPDSTDAIQNMLEIYHVCILKNPDVQESQTVVDLHILSDADVLKLSIEAPEAFEEIIRRYGDKLRYAAVSIIEDYHWGEDAVQDTFLKIYTHRMLFKKVHGAEFKDWAFKIAQNSAKSLRRKFIKPWLHYKDEIRSLCEDETDDIDYSPRKADEAIENLATTHMLRENDYDEKIDITLSGLPPNDRRLLHKFYWEDKTYDIIAKEENLTIGALKMKMFRARNKFRDLLKNDEVLYSKFQDLLAL